MVKYRLFFGTLMTVSFTGIVMLDGWLDGMKFEIRNSKFEIPGGAVIGILIAVLIVLGQIEFSNLAAAKNLRIFRPVSTVASILLAGTWYWPQIICSEFGVRSSMFEISAHFYLLFLLAFVLLVLLLYQYIYYGTTAVLANCGVNCLSIIYLGLLSGFVLAIRIDFGIFALLMFVFVVKSADIGAYAIGTLVGKHKFSPKISPGKTWEGMAGAAAGATIVALAFAASFDIMVWWSAAIFGFCFACVGQAGDLAESMMKRDAQRKDSAKAVPGFGGVLDIIDSPLLAAPFAYLFFMLTK